MKYLAIIDDSMLSNFRRDDDGRTMVVTDKAGASRGIILNPVFEAKPMVIYNGEVVYLSQDCMRILYGFERQKILEEYFKSIEASLLEKTGHWINLGAWIVGDRELPIFKCSVCDKDTLEKGNFCPNCGVKMVEKEDMRNDKTFNG